MDSPSLSLLQQCSLFQDLTPTQLKELMPAFATQTFKENEYILHEGDAATAVFIIKEGDVEVLKKEMHSNEQHHLSYLSKGDIVGELALIDQGPRSASVRALTATQVLAIDLADLQALAKQQTGHTELPAYYKILSSVARDVGTRLRQANTTVVESLRTQLQLEKTRVAMGNLLVILIALVSFYTFALNVITHLAHASVSTTIIGIPIISIFAFGTFLFIKSADYPLSFYGVNSRHWQRSLGEGVIFTLPLLGLIVLGKWLIIKFIPAFSHLTLFDFSAATNYGHKPASGSWLILALPIIYLLLVPLQELMYRGLLQGSIEEFLTGKHRTRLAIFVANFIFSMTHLHVALLLAVMVFPPGLFWGWLYARHRTLIGVTVSHLLAGGWVFFVVGINPFLKAGS